MPPTGDIQFDDLFFDDDIGPFGTLDTHIYSVLGDIGWQLTDNVVNWALGIEDSPVDHWDLYE